MRLCDIKKDEQNLAQEEIYTHKNLTEKQKMLFLELNITKKEVNFILCYKYLLPTLFEKYGIREPSIILSKIKQV
jgi:hypothetical protein